MQATKKSTLQKLSPAGELISDGFMAAAKSHAAKAITDENQPNINKAAEISIKTSTVIIERYNVPRELRDSLLAMTAEILHLAHKEEVAKQDAGKTGSPIEPEKAA